MRFDFNDWRRQLVAEIAEPTAEQRRSGQTAASQRLLNIIDAITPEERSNCDLLLDRPRRERIARDAGESLADIDELIAQRQRLAIMCAAMQQPSELDE